MPIRSTFHSGAGKTDIHERDEVTAFVECVVAG